MNILNISQQTVDFLQKKINLDNTLSELNQEFKNLCGIVDFFENKEDLIYFKNEYTKLTNREGKSEYGDYQTNLDLSDKVCKLLKTKDTKPNIILEPTFGKGSFIISALNNFKNIEQIFGIEIYKPYVQITKLKILDYFLHNPSIKKPQIRLFHANFFDFDIKKQIKVKKDDNLLISVHP